MMVRGGRRHSPKPGFVLTAGNLSSPSPRPGDRGEEAAGQTGRSGSRPSPSDSQHPAPSVALCQPTSLQGISCQFHHT